MEHKNVMAGRMRDVRYEMSWFTINVHGTNKIDVIET